MSSPWRCVFYLYYCLHALYGHTHTNRRGTLMLMDHARIRTQTRATNCEIPADPANVDANTQLLVQAGQVWFPDSAYKTAQSIRDCDQVSIGVCICFITFHNDPPRVKLRPPTRVVNTCLTGVIQIPAFQRTMLSHVQFHSFMCMGKLSAKPLLF